MIGIPASGKSTKARFLAEENNAILIESDFYREKLYGDARIQQDNNALFELIHKDIVEGLQNGDVIFDATNISRKHRVVLLQKLNKLNVVKVCFVMATPVEQCIVQNMSRERQVPNYVIERMANHFQIPNYNEGWDTIGIYFSEDIDFVKYNKNNFIERTLSFDQQNPHHTLTLGHHSLEVYRQVLEEVEFNHILWFTLGALLHDNGKEYTKVFKNHKGEDTTFAHYYNHEGRGAYEGLFYGYANELTQIEILNMSLLIESHMRPYNAETEKSKQKLIKEIGGSQYRLLEILYEADKKSKFINKI